MQASGSLNQDSNAEESVSESAGVEKPGSGLTDTNTGETSTLAAAAAASVSVEQKNSDQIEKAGVSAEPEMETQVEKDELTVTERDDKSLRIERSEEQEASGGAFLFKAPRKKRQRKVTADVVTKKKANYTDDGSSVSDCSQPEKSCESTPWSVSIACKDPEESSEFDSEEEGSQTDCSLTAEPPCTEAGYSVGSIKTFLELTKGISLFCLPGASAHTTAAMLAPGINHSAASPAHQHDNRVD
ncbi:UNVERIFIED_CONTAM: hypothetical protein FKN15_075845 [Acipenser sinensis]